MFKNRINVAFNFFSMEIEDYENDADDGLDNHNVLRDGETLRELLMDYISNL